jgi:putative ATP-binding cassette transporter
MWHDGRGTITRPPLDEIAFLPERPYLPPATLREILLDPRRQTGDDDVLAVLHAVRLETLAKRVGRLDHEHEWEIMLSLGEQQRLALARVLLAEPHFAVLDRIDTALGSDQVRWALQLLSDHSITPIHLTGAGQSLDDFDTVVEIDSDGEWSLRPKEAEPVGTGLYKRF